MTTKVCKVCGIEKHVDEFFVNKKRSGGYTTRCISCYNQLIQYYEETPYEQLPKKKCTKCGELKSASEYYRDWRSEDGLKSSCKECELHSGKKHYHTNKDLINGRRTKKYYETLEYQRERGKKYRIENKEIIKERQKIYRLKNVERIKEKDRRYRLNNQDTIKKYYRDNFKSISEAQRKYRLQNRTRLLEHLREYFKTPAGKTAIKKSRHNRRCREMKSECNLTHEQWEKIIQNQNGKCAMCGKKFCKSRPPTQDHIIPVSKGGGLTFENVQALCKSCNSKKGAKTDPSLIVSYGVYHDGTLESC